MRVKVRSVTPNKSGISRNSFFKRYNLIVTSAYLLLDLFIIEFINGLIIMTTLFIKSLLTSLCQREDLYPSLAKRGEGRFYDLCK
ncbi:MAG: hypothetical protein AB1480_07650, partial [Nitrospirota bacterium]